MIARYVAVMFWVGAKALLRWMLEELWVVAKDVAGVSC